MHMETALPANVLWIVWALILLITVFMTSILAYHWRPHRAYDPHVTLMAKVYYTITGLLLLGSAGILIAL